MVFMIIKKMSVKIVCGFDQCLCSYQSTGALRAHQRKNHPTPYVINGMKIRSKVEPTPALVELDGPVVKIPDAELVGPVEKPGVEPPGNQMVQLRASLLELSETQSSIVAQMTEMKDQMKLLASQNTKWCVVCFERENGYAFMPCGHKCMCKICAVQTLNKFRECPYCRTRIEKIQRIYEVSAWESAH